MLSVLVGYSGVYVYLKVEGDLTVADLLNVAARLFGQSPAACSLVRDVDNHRLTLTARLSDVVEENRRLRVVSL